MTRDKKERPNNKHEVAFVEAFKGRLVCSELSFYNLPVVRYWRKQQMNSSRQRLAIKVAAEYFYS